MNLRKLRRKTLRQAMRERRAGRMTDEQMLSVQAVVDDPKALAELNARVEKDVNPWNRADGLIGLDWKELWANIWDWFVENWPKILEIILTIAPLLILEPKREDS